MVNKVTKVARMLAAKPMEPELEQKSCTVMALLDGGMLKRHKSWLKVLYSLFWSYKYHLCGDIILIFHVSSLKVIWNLKRNNICVYKRHFILCLNFQAEPPTIVVATVRSLCQMLEKQIFKLESMRVLVIDEVIDHDLVFGCYFQNQMFMQP